MEATSKIAKTTPDRQPAYRRAPAVKRQLLLEAARDLFAEQGFENTSTQQISARAGVSEGILFHHFGSKKGLFIEILGNYARDAAAASMPDDPSALTEEQVVRNAFAFAEANPAIYDMLSRSSAELSAADIADQTDILTSAIASNLQRGMDDGRVRQGDATIMAQLQFAVVDAAYRAWRRDGDAARREDFIVEAINCMQSMLAPAPASDPGR